MLALLFEHKADPNIPTIKGDVPGSDGMTPLCFVCSSESKFENHQDRYRVARALLEKGADPNRLYKGSSPLHCAASAGRVDLVSLLVDKGADINLQGNQEGFPGSTALHYAGRSPGARGLAVIVLLCQRGADFNILTGEGNSVLDLVDLYNRIPHTRHYLFYLGAKTGEEIRKTTQPKPPVTLPDHEEL